MSPDRERRSASDSVILVPVDASDPEEPLPGLVDLLSPHRVVVLGYYPVPDQSSTDQLRNQFGEEATAAVEEISDMFSERGDDVDSTVVFTHDKNDTIDRIADEYDADAVFTTGTVKGDLDSILVPLRGEDNLENIIAFVEILMLKADDSATFVNVENSEDDASEGELLVRGACDRLEDAGIDPERLDWRQEKGPPADTLVSIAEEYDLLVVGETEPSLRERLFGDVTNRLAEDTDSPVLVVLN